MSQTLNRREFGAHRFPKMTPRHDSHPYQAGTVRVEPWRWRNQRLFRYVGADRLNGGKLRGDEVEVAMALKARRSRQAAAKEAENAEPGHMSLF